MPDRIARVWNGTSWEVITSTAAAANAVVVYQSASPSGPVTGQVWVDSDDRQFYIWNGSSWISAITTFNYQSASPSGPVTGQIWVDSDDLKFYVWSGSSWVSAITSSNYQSASPSSPTTGQIWINSTTDVMSVWNGTSWIPTKIDASSISSGTLAVARGGTGVTTSTGTGSVVLSSSPTFSTLVTINGGAAVDVNPELTINGVSGYINFHNALGGGSYNPNTATNDKGIIFTNGSVDTGSFIIAPWSNTSGGLKIDGTGRTTFANTIFTSATTATRSGINIPHGTAPTSPVNGDIWTTTFGVFARINGVTIPLGGATGGGADQVFYNNDQTITTNYSIPAGKNSMSSGPITINSGVTVTIPSGSSWSIV